VGYVVCGLRDPKLARVGDTVCDPFDAPAQTTADLGGHPGGYPPVAPLPGYAPATQMVFASVYPVDSGDFETVASAVERLCLTDGSVSAVRESSGSLGLGLRCGFLGLLHMDVFNARLQQEHGCEVIVTAPTVPYRAVLNERGAREAGREEGDEVEVLTAQELPDRHLAHEYREPVVRTSVVTPAEHLGPMMQLLEARRGEQTRLEYLDSERVLMDYLLPWGEVVTDLYDRVKSISAGYASMEYADAGFRAAALARVDIMINGDVVDPLSFVCHREAADRMGRDMCGRLKKAIDRQQFEIAIQAKIGSKIFAKERIAPYRKNVLVKSGKAVGGGDVTRKKKLLEKQKRGKARMKTLGNVQLSQEAFMSVIKRD
jgi:GTP-binding protein LepA